MADVRLRKVTRSLYRSLLQTSRFFDFSAEQNCVGAVRSCLIHRTGLEDMDYTWDEVVRHDHSTSTPPKEAQNTQEQEYAMFRRLLREYVVSGCGSSLDLGQMRWPSMMLSSALKTNPGNQPASSASPISMRDLIRREFRAPMGDTSESESVRVNVAFRTLRELNRKRAWAERLENRADKMKKQQGKGKTSAEKDPECMKWPEVYSVAQLPRLPHCYLQPGTFLVAHPLLTGYFRQSVICILAHHGYNQAVSDIASSAGSVYGTYGLVINRPCVSNDQMITLKKVLRDPNIIPDILQEQVVREGGPVHMSLQMLHATPNSDDSLSFGGTVLPFNRYSLDGNEEVTECQVPMKTVYYQGRVSSAVTALSDEREDLGVGLFVGASSWALGQLEREIERGYWLPCRAPPEWAVALHSAADTPTTMNGIWLDMWKACGSKSDAILAEWLVHESDDNSDEDGHPCDESVP